MSTDDPRVRRDERVLRIAVAFDLVALVGLGLTAVGAFVRGEALGLIFLGAAAGPAAIPGAILSGIALRRVARRRRWPRGRFVVTVAGLSVAAALIGPVALALGWAATPNPAAAAAAPLEDEIRALGGTLLCSNGDPGRGPDNTVPWHEVYFTAPRERTSPQQLERSAGSAGFDDPRRAAGRASSFSDSQRFTLRSGPSARPRADLSIEISPTGTQLDCDPDYGRTYRPADGQVVIDITTTVEPAR